MGQFAAIVGLPWLQKNGTINRLGAGLVVVEKQQEGPFKTTATVSFADPGIPPEYVNYADLFNKKASDELPAHQEWNHRIPLEEKKLPP